MPTNASANNQLTYNHKSKLKASLNRFAVDLVGKICKANIAWHVWITELKYRVQWVKIK